MTRLQLNIEEVENGYIIHDSSGRSIGATGKVYVATTKAALAQLVSDLADSCMKEGKQYGAVQEPEA